METNSAFNDHFEKHKEPTTVLNHLFFEQLSLRILEEGTLTFKVLQVEYLI